MNYNLHIYNSVYTDTYLTLLRAGGLQVSVENLLHHIRKEAGDDDDDDGEPGRTAGQQLDEHKVHVLGVEEGPGGRQEVNRGYIMLIVHFNF